MASQVVTILAHAHLAEAFVALYRVADEVTLNPATTGAVERLEQVLDAISQGNHGPWAQDLAARAMQSGEP